MKTPFEELDQDFRETWRDHPVTVAFIESIAMRRAQCVQALVLAARDGMPNSNGAVLLGGQIRSFDFVMQLAGKGP